MSSQSDATSASADAAQRRWLIGIGITVAFGLFGAVMAILAYTSSTNAPTPSHARQPAGTSAPAPSTTPTAPTPDKPEDRGGKDHAVKDKDRAGKDDGSGQGGR